MVFCECQKDTFLQSIYTIVIVIVSSSAMIGTIERELSMDTMKILCLSPAHSFAFDHTI